MNPDTLHLIIGCGYLGKRLLGFMGDQQCYLTNRTEKSNKIGNATNIQSLTLDINNKDSWSHLDSLSEKQALRIYFLVTPRQIDRTVFTDFIERLNQFTIKRAILVSSTVVYGNVDRIVDADSEVNIDSERAERHYLIEQDWLANMQNAVIVRFAGIYGSDRVIGKNGIINGETVAGDPDGWLNLIHVDDGAQLIKRISEMKQPEIRELACDGNPVKRRDYYSFLAQQLNQPPPQFNQNNATRGGGRRCDNTVTMTRTGWRPEYVDFRNTLTKLIT